MSFPAGALRRRVVQERGSSLSIVLTIAVGIAALTTAFGLADAGIWRQPPFADASRLVFINSTHVTPNLPMQRMRWSYARIQLLKRDTRSFVTLANYTPTSVTLTGSGDAESVRGEFVSPEYFLTLSTRAQHGRPFLPEEDVGASAHPVVVISHDLWARRFASDPAVIGRSAGINGTQLTIIGVMPAGFRGLSDNAQLWLPTTMAPTLTYPEYLTTDQDFINVIARLEPDVSIALANTELLSLAPRVFAALPISDADSGQVSSAIVRGLNEVRMEPRVRRSILLLLSGVALLHLLACTNVISLLLGRAATRRRDVAIRVAIGATPWRLVPVMIADCVVLVTVGGALGVLLAWVGSIVIPAPAELWNTRTFNTALASFAEPAFGMRSALFGVSLTLVTLLLVSWAPAMSVFRMDVASDLRAGSRGSSRGGATGRTLDIRGAIVAVEVALALMLLVAGGLMIDSFQRMRRTDLGIDAARVLTFELPVPDARVSVENAPAFIHRVLDAITRAPGVVSASVDGGAPVAGSASTRLFIIGQPAMRPDEAPLVLRHYVAPDHFLTLGIPLRRGRAFTDRDVAGQPRVAIINELAARRFWPGKDPIGQRVWFSGQSYDHPDSSAEIVGVVGDVAYQPLDQRPFQADFYTPYAQFTYAWRTVFVRTAGDPLAATAAIRSAVHSVEPDIPLQAVQSMTALIGNSWARQRYDALLFGGFAVLAMLLSGTGIYAVVAYAVSQRTREMGIRIALGATAGAVIRLVVRGGMTFPLVGLFIGVAGSLAMSRMISASLYEVSPTDPVVIARTTLLLLLVAAAACFVPAMRATRVDPLEAMRAE